MNKQNCPPKPPTNPSEELIRKKSHPVKKQNYVLKAGSFPCHFQLSLSGVRDCDAELSSGSSVFQSEISKKLSELISLNTLARSRPSV